jgi:steroid 5-alpha reductase family enzyme
MTISSATVIAPPGAVTAYAAMAVAALMVELWLLSLAFRDVSIIDPAWGPASVVVALVAVLVGDGCLGRRWLLLAMTAVWGLRLGIYLLLRKVHEAGEDRRYAALRERRGDTFAIWSLVAIFGLQGLLVLIVSLPIQVAADRGGALTAAVIPGVVLFCVGLAFEASGARLLEKDIGERRPGYAEYVKRTSGFFPLPPRKKGGG